MKRLMTVILTAVLGFAFITTTVNAQTPEVTDTAVPTEVETTTTPTEIPEGTLEPTAETTPTVEVETTFTPTTDSADVVETTSQEQISTKVEVKTQLPWNKKIPITLYVTPKTSGKRLQIRWQSRLGISASPVTYTIENPIAGKTYSKSFTLEPAASGRQRAVADIILTTYNKNYVTSQDVPFLLTKNLEVYPLSSNYLMYKIGMWVSLIAVFLILLPFGAIKGLKYVKENVFPKWLESKVEIPS